jgi:hypothetical protein
MNLSFCRMELKAAARALTAGTNIREHRDSYQR